MSAPTSAAPAAASAAGVERDADTDAAAKAQKYMGALTRGRLATLAKDYPAAIAAFEEALAVFPDDARARAEKGYAEYLKGDLGPARDDLSDASLTPDKTVASQAHFNLGLVQQALKNDDEALLHFWFANQLRPSAAAQSKIGGRAVCPLVIKRTSRPAKRMSSWLEVAHELYKSGSECEQALEPKTEAAAKAAVLPPGAKPLLSAPGKGDFHAVVVGALEKCAATRTYLVQIAGADLWLYSEMIGSEMDNMGHVATQTPATDRVGAWVHVLMTETTPTTILLCTKGDAGSKFVCTGDPSETQDGFAHPESTVYTHRFYDPDAHATVLEVTDHASERFGSGPSIKARADGDGVRFEGLGCGLTLLASDGGR